MIPPTLAAFRALMDEGRGYAEDAHNEWCGPHCKTCDCHDTMSAFQALATATPEQLLGIVGDVVEEIRSDAWSAGYAAASDDA